MKLISLITKESSLRLNVCWLPLWPTSWKTLALLIVLVSSYLCFIVDNLNRNDHRSRVHVQPLDHHSCHQDIILGGRHFVTVTSFCRRGVILSPWRHLVTGTLFRHRDVISSRGRHFVTRTSSRHRNVISTLFLADIFIKCRLDLK